MRRGVSLSEKYTVAIAMMIAREAAMSSWLPFAVIERQREAMVTSSAFPSGLGANRVPIR
jgi:hypothetical protein